MKIGIDLTENTITTCNYTGQFQIHRATIGRYSIDDDLDEWYHKLPLNVDTATYHEVLKESDLVTQMQHYRSVLSRLGICGLTAIYIPDKIIENISLIELEDAIDYLLIQTEKTPLLRVTEKGSSFLHGDIAPKCRLWIESYHKPAPSFFEFDDWAIWRITDRPFGVNLSKITDVEWANMIY